MLRSFMLKHLFESRNLNLTSENMETTQGAQRGNLGSSHLQTEACSVLIMYEVHKMSTPPWDLSLTQEKRVCTPEQAVQSMRLQL